MLDVVTGLKIPFYQIPIQNREPFPYRLSQIETLAATQEIQKLLEKGVLEETLDDPDQVISNIFLTPKKDGSYRMILDLTWVNKHIQYEHFKMCSLITAKNLLRTGCWMGSIDLKDAYYSVLISPQDRKFLRFRWNGSLYQFKAMPNGISCAPRFFTKILNPVFAYLRSQGHETFQYIDDSIVFADSKEECAYSLKVISELLEDLGFMVHPLKSKFDPEKSLLFLGFMLDSNDMTITLTQDKVEKFKRAAHDLLEKHSPRIREVAGLLGLMTSYTQAFDYAPAHVKSLENDKIQALRDSKGSFDECMTISLEGISDIHWWLQNIDNSKNHILLSPFDFILYTDASELGWGAFSHGVSTGGRWTNEEQQLHINALELKAIYLALRSFCTEDYQHVKILTDNTTALAYVKHMGGVRSYMCNQIASDIWNWCELHYIWITISHIPGVDNVKADYKSRKFSDNVEWELNPKIFDRICSVFGLPEVDLFATRLNHKVERYVSFHPDPGSFAVDAFSIPWRNFYFYAFPPFSCVARVISKILAEKATGLLLVPWWPTQPWWARLIKLKLRKLLFRPKRNNLLPIGNPTNQDFLNKCPLVAFRFSDNLY